MSVLYGIIICGVAFGLVRINIHFVQKHDKKGQGTGYKVCSVMLAVPSLALIYCGIMLLFADLDLSYLLSSIILVILAIIAFGISADIFFLFKKRTFAAKFMRHTDFAVLSVPLSLIVFLALHIAGDENTAAIGCMTIVLFGLFSFLIAVNMIVTTLCGYKGTVESIKIIYSLAQSKKPIISRAIIVKDGILVLGKLFITLISASFFMLANCLYSAGLGMGRIIAVRMPDRTKDEQIRDYRKIGVIIMFSSLCYMLYSIRLLFGGKAVAFHMVIALIIAVYTFLEFSVNIREIIKLRKSRALEAKAMRLLSLSSTILCFVLTQTAIMSFAHEGSTEKYNALSGIIFSGIAAFIGIYMMLFQNKK